MRIYLPKRKFVSRLSLPCLALPSPHWSPALTKTTFSAPVNPVPATCSVKGENARRQEGGSGQTRLRVREDIRGKKKRREQKILRLMTKDLEKFENCTVNYKKPPSAPPLAPTRRRAAWRRARHGTRGRVRPDTVKGKGRYKGGKEKKIFGLKTQLKKPGKCSSVVSWGKFYNFFLFSNSLVFWIIV